MSFGAVNDIEKRIFYYLCGFALVSSASIAIGNIFLILTTLGLVHRLLRKHDDVLAVFCRHQKFFKVLAVLIVAMFISIIGAEDMGRGFSVLSDYFGYRLMGVLAVIFCIHDKKKLLMLAGLTLVSITINNAAAICQSFPQFDPNMRKAGFLFCMVQGTILTIAIPIAMVLLGMSWTKQAENSDVSDTAGEVQSDCKKCKCAGKGKWLLIGFLVVALFALYINGTRGAWLAAAIMMLCTGLLLIKNKVVLTASILGLLVLLGCNYSYNTSFQHRANSMVDMQANKERLFVWQSSVKMIEDHPIVGVGLGNFDKTYKEKYINPAAKETWLGHAHNNVLQFFAEGGVIGGCSFLAFWFYMIWFSIRGWMRSRNAGYMCTFCIVMGLMLHGLTEYTFGASVTAKFFWFVLGLSLQWIYLSSAGAGVSESGAGK
ncbi:MAG: O-antigen ligase family protein [Selenomonadaceae bacterium]|nr:O-antigen ligase family protein [Selenomonadaceae bacterium]